MLEPSSSEEDDYLDQTDENSDSVTLRSVTSSSVEQQRSPSVVSGDTIGAPAVGAAPYIPRSVPVYRSSSPTPSQVSEKEREREKDEERKLEEEEETRRLKLQLYVYVMRCIAFHFNAKQPVDISKRHLKMTKQYFAAVRDRFQNFVKDYVQTKEAREKEAILNNKDLTKLDSIMMHHKEIDFDDAFGNAVRSYYEGFIMSDRVTQMVQTGGFSVYDFREVFHRNIKKRLHNLPPKDVKVPNDMVVSSWLQKFDAIFRGDEDLRKFHLKVNAFEEQLLSKEQLYEMFQNILDVKKYEHHLLYNAMQVSCGRYHADTGCSI